MGLNSTVVLTIILLMMMFGAGSMTGYWGYKVGRDALKGITQPDSSPTNNMIGAKGNSNRGGNLVFLSEKDIIKKVKTRINSGGKNIDGEKEAKKSDKANTKNEKAKKTLPIKSVDRGVTLSVYSIRQRGNSLMLDMLLENKSESSVKFLYSFLNVTDDKGRVLSASVEDLPGELSPGSGVYYGTVIIPTALLDKAKSINMTLTDYPAQKLQLKLTEVPVDR